MIGGGRKMGAGWGLGVGNALRLGRRGPWHWECSAPWAQRALALGLLCALGAEGLARGEGLRARGALGLMGIKAQCPAAVAARHWALLAFGFFLFSSSLIFFSPLSFVLLSSSFSLPLLAFCAAVVAGTLDVGAHVGVVAEAGWSVLDEVAYLVGHDGDGVLAE